MTHMKEVYKFKNNEMKVELKECHPRKLPLSSKYIAPYWFQAIQNVFEYSKKRELREIHKLIDDSRIKKGLELYRNKNIRENTVTTAFQGDVHAVVTSQNKKTEYTVIIKNFLPKKPPQYVHEREEYWADLFVDCTCKDFSMGRYRDNASICCKHVCSVLWFLMDKFSMPRIFISPEQKMIGYKKSNVIEQAVEVQALPLVKFTQHLNILTLKEFQGMGTATAISLHKVDNETHTELSKPQWLTYTEVVDVEKIIKGLIASYHEMNVDRNIEESREELVNRFFGKEEIARKSLWGGFVEWTKRKL